MNVISGRTDAHKHVLVTIKSPPVSWLVIEALMPFAMSICRPFARVNFEWVNLLAICKGQLVDLQGSTCRHCVFVSRSYDDNNKEYLYYCHFDILYFGLDFLL